MMQPVDQDMISALNFYYLHHMLRKLVIENVNNELIVCEFWLAVILGCVNNW